MRAGLTFLLRPMKKRYKPKFFYMTGIAGVSWLWLRVTVWWATDRALKSLGVNADQAMKTLEVDTNRALKSLSVKREKGGK